MHAEVSQYEYEGFKTIQIHLEINDADGAGGDDQPTNTSEAFRCCTHAHSPLHHVTRWSLHSWRELNLRDTNRHGMGMAYLKLPTAARPYLAVMYIAFARHIFYNSFQSLNVPL